MWGEQRISAGEFVSLVRGLPAAGAVARAEGVWSDDTELLAGIIEHVDALTRLTYGQSGKRAPWPALRIPRPAAEREPAPRADPMAAHLRRAEGGDR